MIKSLEFENFKSFKGKHKIDIKPHTILVGPNSSGKSTISNIIKLLAQSILDKKNPIILDVIM